MSQARGLVCGVFREALDARDEFAALSAPEQEELIEFLRDPSKFQKLGGKIPKGVLMVGPPGTGKTLAARLIHEGSARRQGPLIAVNCRPTRI